MPKLMKQFAFYCGIFLFLTIGACSTPYYISDTFEEDTADHEIIAILPFEMVYTGNRPAELTDEDFQKIELAESQAFQASFYNEIKRSSKQGRRIRVAIQNYQKTLQLLEKNGIGVKESWHEGIDSLAELLGVDAVVKARIEKNQLMPDLVSFGIGALNFFIDVLFPGGESDEDVGTSKIIYASYYLMDKDDGKTLWSISFEVHADWSRKANNIIEDINVKGVSKFPYRKK